MGKLFAVILSKDFSCQLATWCPRAGYQTQHSPALCRTAPWVYGSNLAFTEFVSICTMGSWFKPSIYRVCVTLHHGFMIQTQHSLVLFRTTTWVHGSNLAFTGFVSHCSLGSWFKPSIHRLVCHTATCNLTFTGFVSHCIVGSRFKPSIHWSCAAQQRRFMIHTQHSTLCTALCVPTGLPLRGGDVAVYANRACPLLFILFLCLFLSLWRFQLYLIPQIIPTTPLFLTLFFRSLFCLIGPFHYISLYESLLQPYSPDVILGG